MKIIPIILCGGIGSRLWPLSRKERPKQFLPIVNNQSLLKTTLDHLKGIKDLANPVIVCNVEHRFLVAEELNKVCNESFILIEPESKNTTAAISCASVFVTQETDIKESIFLVLSSDHLIEDISAFQDSLKEGSALAEEDKLVTFGVSPKESNPNYGYILAKSRRNKDAFYEVEKFLEKPSIREAEKLIKKGNCYWNAGIFMFKPTIFLEELKKYSSRTLKLAELAISNSTRDLDFVRLCSESYKKFDNRPVDKVVLERSKNLVVVPLNSDWKDIGSWTSLYEVGLKDRNNNVILGDVISHNTENSYISSSDDLIVTSGIRDLLIVKTPDSTFIANLKDTQKMDSILKILEKEKRKELTENRKVYRPWGWFDSIKTGDSYQVKKLFIKPGAKLSLQKHKKRAEYWVVVEGVATVINGDEELVLKKGQATYIPLGVKHSLENRKKTTLEVIEVQSGSYFGEDDIVRFEDVYGRIPS